MRVKGRILTFLILTNSAFANVDCNNHKSPDLSAADGPLIEDCSNKTIKRKAKICKCVKKNLEVNKASFPKDPKPSKEASIALNKLALDKVKTAYLATLDNFATLESSSANIENKEDLSSSAPSCHLKKSLPAIKCDNKDTLYSDIEREKMINDFKNQMHAEMLYYRKGKTPDKASGLTDAGGNPKPGLVDRSKVSQSSCNLPLTDDFINDTRNIQAEKAIDLVVAKPIMEELKKVDLNEAFKTLNKKNPEKYKSLNNISFRDLINLTRNDVNSDVTKTDGLESQINSSPTLKNIMNNPDHTEEILNRLKAEKSNIKSKALSSYFKEIRTNSDDRKKVFKKLDQQCESINNNFKKVLCLPSNAKILSTSKAKALADAEIADETCEETNTCLSDDEFGTLENEARGEFANGIDRIKGLLLDSSQAASDSTIILANEFCGDDFSKGKIEEVSLDLDQYIPAALKERKSFEEAANKNQQLSVNKLAKNICGLMPENISAANLDKLKNKSFSAKDYDSLVRNHCTNTVGLGSNTCGTKYKNDPSGLKECNDAYNSDMSGCMSDAETSLDTLYGKDGVYDSLINSYQQQALAEVQAENADRELKPEEVDKLVEAKVKEKSDKLNTKDLMEEYTKMKQDLLARNKSDYVAQIFEGPKERSKHQGRTEKAPEGNVYTAGKTSSSGSTKNEGSKFNSANIKDAGRKIANAFSKKSVSNGNIYNEIFNRARTAPNRIAARSNGSGGGFPPLTPDERRQAVNDAIGSFNPPPRPVERPQIDFDEQDRAIAAEIERDTNPDRTPRDFGGGGSPQIISRPELSPEEQAKKDYNDALQAAYDAKEEAKRRRLNPVPTSGVAPFNTEAGGSGVGPAGASSGAVVNLGKHSDKEGNAFDHSVNGIIADNQMGVSSEASESLHAWLNGSNQEPYVLVDSSDEENKVHLFKESSRVSSLEYIDSMLEFISPVKSAHARRKRKFKIIVKVAPTSNQAKPSMNLFFETIKSSRHVKNNFKDFLNAKRTDSMYQKLLKEFSKK